MPRRPCLRNAEVKAEGVDILLHEVAQCCEDGALLRHPAFAAKDFRLDNRMVVRLPERAVAGMAAMQVTLIRHR